jgi:uncharacterized protein (DUF2384 family)
VDESAPTGEEKTMAKIGRNDPCLCGSGKKYKRCCRNQPVTKPDDFLWRQLRAVDDQLTHQLLKHAKRLYGYEGFEEAWEDFSGGELDEFDLDSPHNPAFFPWYLFNWRPEAEDADDDLSERLAPTVAESYLNRYAKRVSDQERRLIELISQQPFSFHEVMTCDPGQGYRLRDLLLGQEVDVIEHAGSQICQRGDILFGRVIQVDHVGLMMGCGSTLIPPASKPAIIQLRRGMREQEGDLSVHDLHAWERELRELYLAIDEQLHSPPEIRNTEGDPLSLHELYFEIESPGVAFERLKGLAAQVQEAELLQEAEWDRHGQVHAVEFPWLQSGNAKGSAPEHTVLGHLRIEGHRLIASVNSQNRAERIRAEIEARLGRDVRYKATDIQSLSQVLRESERNPTRQDEDEIARFNATPEVQQAVDQMLEAHWRNWLDTNIPALGDQTPREAVQDADGREMVMALLDDMERREHSEVSGLKQQPYIDRARGQLGLHR